MLRRALAAVLFVGLYVSWIGNDIAWRAVQATVFAMLAVWAAAWIRRGSGPLALTWVLAPFAAAAAWGTLQVLLGISVYPYATQVEVLRWLTYLAAFFLSFQLFRERGESRRFSDFFLCASVATAIFSVAQYFTSNGKVFWNFGSTAYPKLGPFLNSDHYCSFIALPLAMAVFRAVVRERRRKLLLAGAAVLFASAVAGASRAGVLLLFCEVAGVLALATRRSRGSARSAAVVAGVLAALAVPMLIGVGWERVFARYLDPSGAVRVRTEIALASFDMFLARPLTGFGLGTWVWVHPEFARTGLSGPAVNAAHNDWLQWLGDGGVPMFAAMFSLFAFAVRVAVRHPWALGVPVVLIHSLVDFPMQGRFLPLAVFIVMGAAEAQLSISDASRLP